MTTADEVHVSNHLFTSYSIQGGPERPFKCTSMVMTRSERNGDLANLSPIYPEKLLFVSSSSQNLSQTPGVPRECERLSNQLYASQRRLATISRFSFRLSLKLFSISINERQMPAVGNTQLFSFPHVPQRPIRHQLALQITGPADILMLRGVVEKRAQTEHDRLRRLLSPVWCLVRPVVGVVVQLGMRYVRCCFARFEHERGADVDGCSGWDVSAGKDAAAC